MTDQTSIRVRVLQGFVLGPGQVTKPGDVLTLDRSFAQQLLSANQVERAPDAPPAPPEVPTPEPESTASEDAEATEPGSKRRRT